MLQLTERRAGIILYFVAISRQHALQKGSTIAVTGEDNMQFFDHHKKSSLDEVMRYGAGKDAATTFVDDRTREPGTSKRAHPREQSELFLEKTRQKGSTIAVTGKDNLQFFGLLLLS
ncbi:hypothetical protein T4D_11167 [Trichinella pseudospiralis]|uniref:Uncharacterized protein n=1 Tax=Trichinella pseudospiralis TaxID=6337 RepID=A0A0V1G327_TRIPS|nr:hypothetical protein T4D_11167 [Trichinella pseudospiralis]